jgi:hypothetical protein
MRVERRPPPPPAPWAGGVWLACGKRIDRVLLQLQMPEIVIGASFQARVR